MFGLMKQKKWLIGLLLGVGVLVFWRVAQKETTQDNAQQSTASQKQPATTIDTQQQTKEESFSEPDRASNFLYDDPQGSLRLEGLVIDESQQPQSGVLITINTQPPRTTTSQQDGSFYFDKLLSRRYQLVAKDKNRAAGPITLRVTETTEPVIVTLRLGNRTTVTVQEKTTGNPIPGATVTIRGITDTSQTTGNKGIASFSGLTKSNYSVSTKKQGYATAYDWMQAAGKESTLTVSLQQGAPVSGTVVDSNDKPISGALVLPQATAALFTSGNIQKDGIKTDDQGEFTFSALPKGSFRMTAYHPESAAQGFSDIVTLDGQTTKTGVVVKLPNSVLLTGTVTKSDGTKAIGAIVKAGIASTGLRWDEPRQVYTDEEGNFEMRGLPQVPLQVVASHATGSSDIQTVDATGDPTMNISLTLSREESIVGTVVDSAGEPLEGIEVSAIPDFTSGVTKTLADFRFRGVPKERTDAGGRFSFTGLEKGPYLLRASRDHTKGNNHFGGETKVEASATDVTIALPVEGSITGKVTFDDGSVPSSFAVSTNQGWNSNSLVFSDKDGSFSLSSLEPRKYTLTITGQEFDKKQVADVIVKEAKQTDVGTITVSKGRTIAGKVVANGKAVPAATVLLGTQILTDGAGAKSPFGGQGTVKEATTDDYGNFRIQGVSTSKQYLTADHPQHGRSQTITIEKSEESSTALSVPLVGIGSLGGQVTKNGKAAANTMLMAKSKTASGIIMMIRAGEDGKYFFDKMTPGDYEIIVLSSHNMMGAKQHTEQTTIESGKRTTLDISISTGSLSLVVTLDAQGKDYSAGIATLFAGEVSATSPSDLEEMSAPVATQFAMNSSSSIVFEELTEGQYSLCAFVIPKDIALQDIGSYMNANKENLSLTCEPLLLQEDKQKLTVEVTLPAELPDNDKDTDGDSEGKGDQ